jgi:hypothetical protein
VEADLHQLKATAHFLTQRRSSSDQHLLKDLSSLKQQRVAMDRLVKEMQSRIEGVESGLRGRVEGVERLVEEIRAPTD